MKVILTFLGIILWMPFSAAPQGKDSLEMVRKSGFETSLTVSSQLQYYLEPANSAGSDSVPKRNFNTDFPTFIYELKTHPVSYNFWQKFTLRNNSDQWLNPFLFCGDLNYINLYLLIAGHPAEIYKGGNLRLTDRLLPFIEQTSEVISFRLAPGESATAYIRIRQRTDYFGYTGITLMDHKNLYEFFGENYNQNRTNILLQILFQGFILCQIFYVFFQWIIIRHKEYVYYLLYLVFISLYFLSRQESVMGVHFIFTRYPQLAIYLNKTLQIIPYFLYFRFTRAFLDLKQHFPALDRWMKRIEYFLLAYLVFDLIFILITLNTRLQLELFIVVITLVFFSTAIFIIFLFAKRQTLTNYIVTGSFFVGLGNIAGLVLSYLKYDAHVAISINNLLLIPQAGIILEIFCFTSGLSYKSMMNEKDKIRSQNRLIDQLKANESLQLRMQVIRNKIGQDLHDDIGATLSTILLYSNAATRKGVTLQREEAMDIISKISTSANQMIDEMSDIVWTINPRNDGLEKILGRMLLFASSLLSANDIQLDFHADDAIASEQMMMDKKKNFYLIFKEAINNAIKYAGCSAIRVSINKINGMLEMSITDNGRGFDLLHHQDGNGLLNMQQRATDIGGHLDITTSPGKGSSVRLAFPLEDSVNKSDIYPI